MKNLADNLVKPPTFPKLDKVALQRNSFEFGKKEGGPEPAKASYTAPHQVTKG